MALTILTGSSQAAGVNYSYSTSGSADWTSVPTASYFYDIIDKTVRYKTTNSEYVTSLTSSTALTASYAISAQAFPFTGSALITGSLGVTGSASILATTSTTSSIFNVRNSASTANIIEARGNASIVFANGVSTYSLNPRTDADGFSLNSGNGLYGTGTGMEVVSNQFLINNSGVRTFRFSGATVSNVWILHNESNQLRICPTTDTTDPIVNLNGTTRFVGVGILTPAARLDVRAQGALSTDIAFRVRNSADTKSSFEINGLGQGIIRSTSFTPKFSISYVSDAGVDRDAFIFTQNVQNAMGRAWTFDAGYNGAFEGLRIFNDLTGNDQGVFTIQSNNYCFGTSILNSEGSITERRVLRIANGVAPSISKTDEFKFYSADRNGVAGKASPHFRTEDGTIIWLGDESRLFNVTASNITASNVIASSLTIPSGSITLTTGSITMPNRPAFRVTGAGGGKVAVTTLSGSYLNVDYQQGGGWDNSTGTFTAPIAGLYQVNLVTRTNSNSLGTISQLIVYKNNTGGTTGTPQVMIEFGANTTMNHTGGSTISKLAVGDTLKMVVAVGEISFDANDNFSVAYIG
jgi:hypothetical protein